MSQIREVAATPLRYAKGSGVPVILVGHITKEGSIAGPKILEHIVDVVLQFEGENRGAYRVLRSIKNRFGSTSELAVFEMTGTGLREVENPSELLIPEHGEELSGTAIAAMLDGNRPFMFEVQALVASAAYGTAQRSATGFDVRRLNMLLAVLDKRGGLAVSGCDAYINVIGGLDLDEPAADLAAILALSSSFFDLSLGKSVAAVGEVGLSGEVRGVSYIDQRVSEIARHGFTRCVIPAYSAKDLACPDGLELIPVSTVKEAISALLGKK